MTASLTPQVLTELTASQTPPCLSLYMTTHRRHPENQQEPIRYGNLLKALHTSLLQQFPRAEAQALLAPFVALADDQALWAHTADGLAVLGCEGLFRVFHLQQPVAELAIAADSFHTQPLRRVLQSPGRYQVLGLSLGQIQLFEGQRDSLTEVALAPGVPRTLDEAQGNARTEPHHTVSSHGGLGQGHSAMRHGQGGQHEVIDADAERFFRAVDRAVLDQHSRPSGLPLVLAALPQHHALFRRVSHNPFLMSTGLHINPDVAALGELGERAWQLVSPQHEAQMSARLAEFAAAMPKGLGGDDLAQVAQAAAAGRVATLLIESDRHWPGRLDATTGRIEAGDLADPQVDDVLDDLGTLVEKLGGQVLLMPKAQMPGFTGLAAIYRH